MKSVKGKFKVNMKFFFKHVIHGDAHNIILEPDGTK